MIQVSVIQNPYLFTVRFKDENEGLISGLGGVVLRSRTAAAPGATSEMDRKQALFSVAAADGRAIAVGEKGFVRVSDDGGASWAAPADELPDDLHLHARPRLRCAAADRLHRRPAGQGAAHQGRGQTWKQAAAAHGGGRRPRPTQRAGMF